MEMMDRQGEDVHQVFQNNHSKTYWNSLFHDEQFGEFVTEI